MCFRRKRAWASFVMLNCLTFPSIAKNEFNFIESRSVAVRKTKGAARRLKFEWPLAKLTDEKNA